MIKAVLRKMKSTHNKIRTDEIVGELLHLPEVGSGVILFSEPLNGLEGYARMISTTPVVEITPINQNLYTLRTKNSTYELEILSETAKS